MDIISEITKTLRKAFLLIEYRSVEECHAHMPTFKAEVEQYARDNADNLSDSFILYCLL